MPVPANTFKVFPSSDFQLFRIRFHINDAVTPGTSVRSFSTSHNSVFNENSMNLWSSFACSYVSPMPLKEKDAPTAFGWALMMPEKKPEANNIRNIFKKVGIGVGSRIAKLAKFKNKCEIFF